ncbi:MAG: hypothetical protein Q4C65_12480 [Eubacteriales bacterium]|nr:hypothetical protein [Eubacteriales bacterium]
MLMILIQWCYFALTSFLTGFAALAPFQKNSAYRIRCAGSYMMAGLLVLNVYAEYFSLFSGVGLWANALAAAFDLCAAAVLRKRITAFLREWRSRTGKGKALLYLLLLLLFAYGSSRGYMHYDTGLYHAQAIRWIEEYGVVPGLANLHSRFGYNSAAFALCALFGGAGLTKYPMHCVAGFFALLCAVRCTGLLTLARRRRVRLTDFLYAGCIFYLVAVFRELVSPASDYFAMLILFWVVICWAELWESGEREPLPFCLLSLYLVYAATVKLSTAVLLVLALYPAVLLVQKIKERCAQGARPAAACLPVLGWLSLGFAVALPYLARNVLISGWLFYPFTFFDWFSVDWKLSKGYADSDAREIRAYAMQIFDVYKLDTPFSVWFPNWLKSQDRLDRLLVLAGWAALPVSALLAGCGVYRGAGGGPKKNGPKKRGSSQAGFPPLAFALLQACALLGFLFWQFGAPLVRYGYFYVLFLPLAAFGSLYVMAADAWEAYGRERRGSGRLGFYLFTGLLVAFLAYKGYNLIQMIRELGGQPYYIWQQDYGDDPAYTYEVDGVTIYVPTDRGQIGYSKFPSSPVEQDIELRGGTLRSGFRARKEK